MNIEQLSQHSFLHEMPKFFLQNEQYSASFKSAFQLAYPELYADIESYTSNPNCTCKNKIFNVFTDNKMKAANFILSFLNSVNISLDNFIIIFEKTLPVEMGGKIIKTSMAKWKDFYNEIKNNKFMSFSILKDGDDILVFFL